MKLRDILILIVLVIPSIFNLFRPGFYGASDDMHIAWLQQMDQSLKMGQIPPRYIPDLSFGFGYPLFNFIFPLPYYLAEVFHLTGLSFVYSIKAVFVVSMVFSALSMYLLVKHLSGKYLAMAAAILYVYTPYRSTDVYVRGALGESLAFVFLPLVVYFLIRTAQEQNRLKVGRWLGAGALSVAGLILTHNIVSYMFVPGVLVLGVYLLRKRLIDLVLFFSIGLFASLYFWLPALIDSTLMRYETVFNYFDHFPAMRQLITPFWGYGASVPGPYDGMSFFVGEVNLLIIGIIGMGLLLKFKTNVGLRLYIGWSGLLILISVLLMNHRSAWLWERLPLIAYFQFPWRYLTLIVFGSALMVIGFKDWKAQKYIAIMIIILAIGVNAARFQPHDYLNRTDDYYINRYIPLPVPSTEYLGLMEEYLRLPRVAQQRPTELYPRVFPLSAMISNITLINSLDAMFVTNSDEPLLLNYNKYFFPGWEGYVDGQRINLEPGNPFGQISFLVPNGKHDVYIRFTETTRNKIFDLISVISVGMALYLIWGNQIKFRRT